MQGSDPEKEFDEIPSTGELSLLDLIALDELQHLQDALAEIGHVKSVITDPGGHLLTMPSNDIPICRIVGQSARGSSDCLQWLSLYSEKIRQELRPNIYSCEKVGVLKAAVPIIVQNQHLGNWWISQYCKEVADPAQTAAYARRLGIGSDLLLHAAELSGEVSRAEFEKVFNWIALLAQRITQLGFRNLMLAQTNTRMQDMQKELDRYKRNLEGLIQARTAELAHSNQRLQLEVMERDLMEEQTTRKSKLLDAINQVLHQIVADRNEHTLAGTCLRAAQNLTGSPFGFLVERQEGSWQMMAVGQEASSDPDYLLAEKSTLEIRGIWQQVVQTGEPVTFSSSPDQLQVKPLMPKGSPEIKTLLAVPLPKDSGLSGFIALANNPRGYALIDQSDVTALAEAFAETLLRARAEQAKYLSEKRLNLALDSADEGLWDYLPQSGYIYYSPRWFTMLDYNVGELPYTLETWTTLTHPQDLPVLKTTLEEVVQGKHESFRMEIRMLSQGAQWHWVQARGRTVEKDEEGRVQRIVGTLIDISKYKNVELALQKANEELQRLAALDDLTQIANRRRFDERLADEWRRARRGNSTLAVILCDIDFFKAYNDTYGHVKGDEALYAVAQATSAILKRPMDLVARYGGEEIAVVLPNTDLQGATLVAKEVKAAIEDLQIPHQASKVSPILTLSFGVAACIPAGDTPARFLVEQADKALYKAKELGRNQIVQANPADRP